MLRFPERFNLMLRPESYEPLAKLLYFKILRLQDLKQGPPKNGFVSEPLKQSDQEIRFQTSGTSITDAALGFSSMSSFDGGLTVRPESESYWFERRGFLTQRPGSIERIQLYLSFYMKLT